jgi:hypothetical protein
MIMKRGGTLEPVAAVRSASEPEANAVHPGAFWPIGEMRIVWAVLFLYVVGFICFYPRALTNFDEVSYVRQAVTFSAGSSTVDTIDPYTGQHQKVHPSDYPPGTSALMTPFVWLGGWRGAFLLGLLAAVACVLFTAQWIGESGGSPLYALLVLGFVPTLVMARVAMSDVPSACLVAAGLWLFWSNDAGTPWRRLAAGFIAGASLCLREPNPILFAIFFAGAVVRRERHLIALVGGGLAGVACRFVGSALVYGNPLFVKVQFYGFTGLHLGQNLRMYLPALLLLVPGGLIFALAYRGPRWPELVSTVAVVVGMFLVYNYDASSSGGIKQWVLSLRFMIPLLPILAFAMAYTCPRWYRAFTQSMSPPRRMGWDRLAKVAVATWLAGVVAVGLAVNWRSELWSALHQQAVQALYSNTDPSQPVVADIPAMVKFLSELHGPRMVAELKGIQDDQIRALVDHYPAVQIVSFDRNDSEYWLTNSKRTQAFVESLSAQFPSTLKLEQVFPGLGVLRIWNVRAHR